MLRVYPCLQTFCNVALADVLQRVTIASMYLPQLFAVEELPRLHDFMDEFNFATVVTGRDGELTASHIPFLLDRGVEPYGTLRAHLAIRNPQLEDFRAGSRALVIFQGPHTYVSPSWYVQSENVPTWNYTVVHAYGVPTIGDPAATVALPERAGRPSTRGRLKRLGTSIRTPPGSSGCCRASQHSRSRSTSCEGKFKLNQNRTPADRAGVIEHTCGQRRSPATRRGRLYAALTRRFIVTLSKIMQSRLLKRSFFLFAFFTAAVNAGTLYLPAYPTAVLVFDEAKGQVVDRIPLETGTPMSMRLAPDHKKIYVTTIDHNGIEVIDVATRKVTNHFVLNTATKQYRFRGGAVDPGRQAFLHRDQGDRQASGTFRRCARQVHGDRSGAAEDRQDRGHAA